MQNKRPRAKRRGRRPRRLHGKLLKLNAPRLLALTLPPLRTPKIFVSRQIKPRGMLPRPTRRRLMLPVGAALSVRSEEHTSELQSLMRISYAVFCLKKKHKRYNQYDKLNTREETQIHTPSTKDIIVPDL